jgi:hypothetical protein
MRWFIAGIMQGSLLTEHMHQQDYRSQLSQLIFAHFPDDEIFDPFAKHTQSIEYSDDIGREVFLNHNRIAGEVDVLLAYVPEATMGTAIEMWEAFRNNVPVITISPLTHSWAVKFTSDLIFHDIDAIAKAFHDGQINLFLSTFHQCSQ